MTEAPRPLWWEEIREGQRFDFGSKQVTREEVIRFASEFDPQPFHLSDDAASTNPLFSRMSASGVHVFAMTSRLIFDGFAAHGIHPIGGGGLDELRFLAPVYPGDVLTLTLTIASTRALATRPDRGLVKIAPELANQDGVPVQRYFGTFFLPRRPQD